jgi:Zn-dependent peptidase ImmA (M78 family)
MTAVTAAERILMGLGISDPKEIDLEAIAWSRGVLVEYRPLDGCDATIVGSAQKAVIAVNSRRSPERRRFSIGHELGHWHHHKGRILFCGGNDVDNPADDALNPERHADEFASDLILPNYLLHPRLRKIKRITLAVPRVVGHAFSASLTAILLKTVQSNASHSSWSATTRVGVAGSGAQTWCRPGGSPLNNWTGRVLLPTCYSMAPLSKTGPERQGQMHGSIFATAIASRWRSNPSCCRATKCLRFSPSRRTVSAEHLRAP